MFGEPGGNGKRGPRWNAEATHTGIDLEMDLKWFCRPSRFEDREKPANLVRIPYSEGHIQLSRIGSFQRIARAEHEDGCVEQFFTQLNGFRDGGYAEEVSPANQCGARAFDCAVAIAVGFYDGHEASFGESCARMIEAFAAMTPKSTIRRVGRLIAGISLESDISTGVGLAVV